MLEGSWSGWCECWWCWKVVGQGLLMDDVVDLFVLRVFLRVILSLDLFILTYLTIFVPIWPIFRHIWSYLVCWDIFDVCWWPRTAPPVTSWASSYAQEVTVPCNHGQTYLEVDGQDDMKVDGQDDMKVDGQGMLMSSYLWIRPIWHIFRHIWHIFRHIWHIFRPNWPIWHVAPIIKGG